jgi:hypothetical protein
MTALDMMDVRQSAMPRRLLPHALLFALLAACTSTTTSAPSSPGIETGTEPPATSDGTTPGEGATEVDPALLAGACTGGCGDGQACAVESDTCESGLCGVDYRSEKHTLACTADCRKLACPIGWECVDVFGKEQGMRACLPSRERITLDLRTYVAEFVRLKLDTTVPAAGGANECGKVEVLSDTAKETALRVTACGKAQSDGDTFDVAFTFEFAVPHASGKTFPAMKVSVSKPPKGGSTFSVCNGMVDTTDDGARIRTATISADLRDGDAACNAAHFSFPLDGIATLDMTRP